MQRKFSACPSDPFGLRKIKAFVKSDRSSGLPEEIIKLIITFCIDQKHRGLWDLKSSGILRGKHDVRNAHVGRNQHKRNKGVRRDRADVENIDAARPLAHTHPDFLHTRRRSVTGNAIRRCTTTNLAGVESKA